MRCCDISVVSIPVQSFPILAGPAPPPSPPTPSPGPIAKCNVPAHQKVECAKRQPIRTKQACAKHKPSCCWLKTPNAKDIWCYQPNPFTAR